MGTQPTEVDVAAIRDLLSRSALKAIEFHELSARWTGSKDDDGSEDADVSIELQHRHDETTFGFRMVGQVKMSFGQADAAVAVAYDYEGDTPDVRTLLAFANEVAVMTVFPYFREAIGTITGKVFGSPMLVPVMPRGDIGFDLDEVQS
jgi:hypothetical protein